MLGIAEGLRERGWHVEVAVGSDELIDRFKDAGIPVHVVPGLALGDRSPLRMAKGAARLRRIAARGGFDVVHSFNAQAGLLAWLAVRGLGVKVVNTVLGAGKEGLLKRMPFPIIAVSDFVKRDLVAHGVPENRITTVYNGILTEDRILDDEAAFKALWREREAVPEFRVVGIAMMNGDKGHHASIAAIARASERDGAPEMTMTFVGDGTRRADLERFAQERGIAKRVRFAGALDNVFPELDRAHAFLHLSPQETFGMVLAEAHARGLPAVSYRVGGIPEVVEDRVSGILVDAGDVDGVVNALVTLASDRARCIAMGREGLARTRRLFMRPALAKAVEGVYETL
mgnify:FL=1